MAWQMYPTEQERQDARRNLLSQAFAAVLAVDGRCSIIGKDDDQHLSVKMKDGYSFKLWIPVRGRANDVDLQDLSRLVDDLHNGKLT